MALVLTMCSAFSLKKDHSKTVYAFGIAASKEGFLTHRDLYSYQLKNYVEDNGLQQNSTCMIYFSENRKKLEKEATKILSKYKRNRNTTVTRIDTDKFHFIKPEE